MLQDAIKWMGKKQTFFEEIVRFCIWPRSMVAMGPDPGKADGFSAFTEPSCLCSGQIFISPRRPDGRNQTAFCPPVGVSAQGLQ